VTPASAPTVTAPTAAQQWVEGHAIKLALPGNTFTDPQGGKLTYKATIANGSALPSWLKFNAKTDTFTGKTPGTASTLGITVTVKDTRGLSASETFSVSIAAAAGKCAQAASSLTPPAGLASTALSQLFFSRLAYASVAHPLIHLDKKGGAT
jgi:hypothetical protein